MCSGNWGHIRVWGVVLGNKGNEVGPLQQASYDYHMIVLGSQLYAFGLPNPLISL